MARQQASSTSPAGQARASKRCWDCRDRKIACDKKLPGCLKCQQRGKTCSGYGLRLSWPKDDDVRRSARGAEHYLLPQSTDGYDFVDASHGDIRMYHGETAYLDAQVDKAEWSILSSVALSGPLSLAPVDPTLCADGSHVPALFASVPDEFGDLYSLLVRMSLTDDAPPSLATRHALAALSYQSLGQKHLAYAHQATAIRALQTAIESRMLPPQSFQAMAASMLLNYHETLDENGSPFASAVYFCGCKRIAMSIFQEHRDYQGDLALVLDWIFYHDTMYKFSIHHWAQRTAQQEMIKNGPKLLSKAVFSRLRHIVNPAIGCSLALLENICQIVDIVRDPADPAFHAPDHLKTLRQLEIRLDSTHQHVSLVVDEEISPGEDIDGAAPRPRRLDALEVDARLYHIAAQLYLQRLGRAVGRDAEPIQRLLDEAFGLLATPGRGRRPWVLFVVGVDARNEEERHLVMRSITRPSSRHFARQPPLPTNLAHVKRLIQAAWTQLDLLSLDAASKEPSILQVYNTVISANEFPPLFA